MSGEDYNNKSLYVGDLHPNVGEAELLELFKTSEGFLDARVPIDQQTRRSLQYAYINFKTSEQAKAALKAHNYTQLQGKEIRIMWRQPDPSKRRSGEANIFIKNLNDKIDNKTLHETFLRFGDITSCKVAFDEAGRSKGYGFVQYTKAEDAQKAIDEVNGKLLLGNMVTVEKFRPRRERAAGEAEASYNNLYVRNLPKSYGDAELGALGAEFGAVLSPKIARGADGESKGHGFISFKDAKDAVRAQAGLNGRKIKDGDEELELYAAPHKKKAQRLKEVRKAMAERAAERESKYQGRNLYVRNLNAAIDDRKLVELFREFGSITSAVVSTDPAGYSKGFGFVCFETEAEASNALRSMNSKIVEGKPLFVAMAQRRDARKKQLEQRFARGQDMQFPHMGNPSAWMQQAAIQQQMLFNSMKNRGFMYPQGMVPQGMPGQPGQPGMGRGRWANGAQMPPNMMRPFPQGMLPPQGAPGVGQPGQGMPAGAGQPGLPPQMRMMQNPAMGLDAEALLKAPENVQKRTLGDRLFPMVRQDPQIMQRVAVGGNADRLTGRIVGMMLMMKTQDLLRLTQNQEDLARKIKEGLTVLDRHAKANAAQAQAQAATAAQAAPADAVAPVPAQDE